ncbi:hypothetical protein IMSAG025_01354 [Muribaculaceae bacterium]|nr:hypothetical protein IMSAG025_01354 [Muribaculaceae bacterium]
MRIKFPEIKELAAEVKQSPGILPHYFKIVRSLGVINTVFLNCLQRDVYQRKWCAYFMGNSREKLNLVAI